MQQHAYYNQLSPIRLREYGRNIQGFIEHIPKLSDKDQRNQAVRLLLKMMRTINPNVRQLSEDAQKLWDDLFTMADYKLEVDAPHPIPQPNAAKAPLKRPAYPANNLRMRQYGRSIEQFIKKACSIQDPDQQAQLLLSAIRIMRNCNTNLYQDHNVNLERVLRDIQSLAGGQLLVDLNSLKDQVGQPPKNNNPSRRPQGNYRRARHTPHKRSKK